MIIAPAVARRALNPRDSPTSPADRAAIQIIAAIARRLALSGELRGNA